MSLSVLADVVGIAGLEDVPHQVSLLGGGEHLALALVALFLHNKSYFNYFIKIAEHHSAHSLRQQRGSVDVFML